MVHEQETEETQVWDEGIERMSNSEFEPRSFSKYELDLNEVRRAHPRLLPYTRRPSF